MGWGAAIGAIAGAGIDLLGTKQSAEASKANTAAQIKWEKQKFEKEKELANTAHQREVADLEAAGLNKILTVNGGGAPMATMGSINPQMPDFSGYSSAAEHLGQGIKTALDISIKRKEAEKAAEVADATIDKTKAEADSIRADMAPGGIKEHSINESIKRQAVLETEKNLNEERQRTEKTMQQLNKRYSRESITRALKNQQETVTEAVETQIKQFELDTSPWRATIGAIKSSLQGIVGTVCLPFTLKGMLTPKLANQVTKTAIKKNWVKPKYLLDKNGQIIKEYD